MLNFLIWLLGLLFQARFKVRYSGRSGETADIAPSSEIWKGSVDTGSCSSERRSVREEFPQQYQRSYKGARWAVLFHKWRVQVNHSSCLWNWRKPTNRLLLWIQHSFVCILLKYIASLRSYQHKTTEFARFTRKLKVAVHTSDVLWHKNCIVNPFTQLNCDQLQCILVVNKPIAMHSKCQWTIKFSGRINIHFELD